MTETFIPSLSFRIVEVENRRCGNESEQYKIIGQAIKKYRKQRGLTQEQLADRVSISISYLTKIEAPNCDQPFSLEVIFDIAEVLEIPAHVLLEDL